MAYVKVLRCYRFIDKDPVIDELRTILQDVGMFDRLGIVAELSGLGKGTLRNMFHGDTRKPQNATVMGTATSVGYERKFVRARKLDADKELEFARAWNAREKAKRAKAPKRAKRKRVPLSKIFPKKRA